MITGRGLAGSGGRRLMMTRRGGAGPGGSFLVMTVAGWSCGGVGGSSRTIRGDGVRGVNGLKKIDAAKEPRRWKRLTEWWKRSEAVVLERAWRPLHE